tara:strand:- start:4089 stop:4823 length:735 start_codon:yes stop_codon:yes gene_type:complete
MESLEKKAENLRKKVIDLSLENNGDGHLGGCFSEIEVLISLYDKILKKDDKFILSKGHNCYPLYLILREKGYNPKILGHPDIDIENGICCTTGSLGHGLPIGTGMALAKKLQNKKGNIYVLMGDGECQEGTTWETIPLAVKYKLDNLTVIVDRNKLQALEEIANVTPMILEKAFSSFGCYTKTIDGHEFSEIISTLNEKNYERPRIIIANTTKGKGVSYMENDPKWHGRKVLLEEVKGAYEELK